VAATAIAWGIARALRNRRLARELLDPGRFVEATFREDGTLRLEGDPSAIVLSEGVRHPPRPGPVLVRIACSNDGDYRRAPSVRAEVIARGGRVLASQRAMGRASLILNGLMAVAVSAAIFGSFCALNACVQIGFAEQSLKYRHDGQRHGLHRPLY
jgi:hypothetical protein